MTEEAICQHCKKKFIRVHPSNIYCCDDCRYTANKEKNRERKNRLFRTYDKEEFPYAGVRKCLKCEKDFMSWNTRKNCICDFCRETNKDVRNNFSAVNRSPRKGARSYGN